MALSKEYQKCDMERIKELCSKFPKEYADLFELVSPIIIDYLGKENESVVLQTLEKIEIEATDQEKDKRLFDVIDGHRPDNYVCNSGSMVNPKLVNMASGVYQAWPVIEEKDGRLSLEDERMIMGVKPLKYSFNGIATYVHEFLHAVKSSNDQFSIIDDKDGKQYLRERCGLIYSLYDLNQREDGVIESSLVREMNTGIEEGINTVDEYAIMNQLLGIPLDQLPENCRYIVENVPENERHSDHQIEAGYRFLATSSSMLLDDPKTNKDIREAQLYGKYMSMQRNFNELIGEPQNNWQALSHNMDVVAEKMYELYQNLFIFTPEKLEAFKQDLSVYRDNVSEIISKAQNAMERKNKGKDQEQDER